MTLFKEYRDMLGRPHEGAHAERLGPFAAWDVIGTVVVGYALGGWPGVMVLWALGTALHWLFDVDAAFLRMVRNNDE